MAGPAADTSTPQRLPAGANGSTDAGAPRHQSTGNAEHETDDDDEEEEDDEDDEPRLKYESLTGSLNSVYRNGDATSAFLVAADKMIIGTHNGRINVLALPNFQTVRLYHAHSASVTAVSVSPFPPPWPTTKSDIANRLGPEATVSPSRASTNNPPAPTSPRTPRQNQVQIPATPSNSIHIATSSIDGHVCIQSLTDTRDVMLRNFARPVQAVALSPEYRSDKSYLSGGLAGELILTVGGRSGVSTNANTSSAAAVASGWLGSIGLGSNNGRDSILHSGEGAISIIKWSLSSKYVAWVNEQGIKIMRSNVKLESGESDLAWKRIAHVDRPNRRGWEDMAAVWKARIDWIDDQNLESDSNDSPPENSHQIVERLKNAAQSDRNSIKSGPSKKPQKVERLVVGWGDTTWIIHVKHGGPGVGKDVGEPSAGTADIVHILRFGDCIISGLSLYTPSLLLVLAYRTRDDDDRPIGQSPQTTPRRGVQHRQDGLPPELRLVDIASKDELDFRALSVSRFESLSAADYHLSTLYVPILGPTGPAQKGALEVIGGGLWDAGVSAGRILSSGASILSLANSADNGKASIVSPSSSSIGKPSMLKPRERDTHPALATAGLKIFIHSPYDCVLAVKRDLADHLNWLLEHEDYKQAWELINEHPEAVTNVPERNLADSPTTTPSKTQPTLAEFFADDSASQTTASATRMYNSAIEKEKRRIGDLWVQQLVTAGDWETAGKVAGKVLGTSSRWEHWVWTFAEVGRFDEITPYIPSTQLKPPLPSLLYEVVLGHYIVKDRVRLKELVKQWDTDLFEITPVIKAIEAKLGSGDVTEVTVEDGEQGRDWRILQEILAKLLLADGKPREALKCYIRLQNADAAMDIIRDYNLLHAIADDIPGFILLRVSKDLMESGSMPELEEASSDAIHLLVDEAFQGVVRPDVVVAQLEQKGLDYQPFLFFYLRELWNGKGIQKEYGHGSQKIESEGRSIVEEFADLAVELFAEYDRQLLMNFLKASQSYTFETACQICERRQYIPELVYLLSKTGQTKRALHLITATLGDVSLAISFAKEQDDPDLWDDLLDYSMDKPRFIRGLLEEVGTAINPLMLVRRIPEGLEIEGLRDGIHRMLREYEIQYSISEGVAKVLRGEVAEGMAKSREGRLRAVKFEVVHQQPGEVEVFAEPVDGAVSSKERAPEEEEVEKEESASPEVEPGYCVGCRYAFAEDEKETLVGFACGHVFHLSCLLHAVGTSDEAAEDLQMRLASFGEAEGSYTRSVGAKVAHAHIIRNAIKGGCPECLKTEGEE
ncbi:hypothetical protein BDY21DRAFT_190069 [Lineolata rhizophorae]|uniref:Vps41 beta-propeller domain-containing protein n=1 Tax=Lineolata rhizophorae TaxID=578093 RepID=A0A6A6P6H1_9PEZI|nr:hypothetical protein BDY21DRAFT_190069 [Lineolata rhizophorae]